MVRENESIDGELTRSKWPINTFLARTYTKQSIPCPSKFHPQSQVRLTSVKTPSSMVHVLDPNTAQLLMHKQIHGNTAVHGHDQQPM